MDRKQFEKFLQHEIGEEAAEFLLAILGDEVEDFVAIDLNEPVEHEPLQDKIQRDMWFSMYPVVFSKDTREGGCPNCGQDSCIGARIPFPSHVN